ncbi:MAG TPA: LacI family DNA-binding transcriptional regulator [Dongiaceae bacterium]|jgi:DNA-binding LacI/PurR family transcriptional regulator|nr:LacI family DNA-binding transcriptional regulator [Dongiaceae bacterium]
MNRPKRATSYDVAEAADVSQSTVSRAFSGGKVSSEVLERIQDAARKLGYRPNELARSLISRKSNMIGLVMGNTNNPFYPTVMSEFTQELQRVGRRVLLFSVPAGQDVDAVLPEVLQYHVAGVIIASATISSKMARLLKSEGTPTLVFNRAIYEGSVNSVCCANEPAARLVAQRLLKAGHRRFGLVGGQADTSTHIERRKAFAETLAEAGIAKFDEESGLNSYEGGFAAGLSILGKKRRPDAVFCISDIAALGVLEAARHKLGLNVPGDVSIVGFDDIPEASWPSYSLTTVRQPVKRMVAESVSLLLGQIDGKEPVRKAVRIPGELIIRTSARI